MSLSSKFDGPRSNICLCSAPPEVVASWPRPNYVDPVTEGPALVILGIVLGAVASFLVTARIYSRLFITRAPGLDDFLIVLSLVST